MNNIEFAFIHGIFNFGIFFVCIYQAITGIRIRKNRLRQVLNTLLIRKHRKLGPAIFILILTGYIGGLLSVYVMWNETNIHKAHSILGLVIVTFFFIIYLTSKKITVKSIILRKIHLFLGFTALILYFIQIILGANILLTKISFI